MITLQIVNTLKFFTTIVFVTIVALIYFLYVGVKIQSRGTIIITSFCIAIQMIVLIIFKFWIFRDFGIF